MKWIRFFRWNEIRRFKSKKARKGVILCNGFQRYKMTQNMEMNGSLNAKSPHNTLPVYGRALAYGSWIILMQLKFLSMNYFPFPILWHFFLPHKHVNFFFILFKWLRLNLFFFCTKLYFCIVVIFSVFHYFTKLVNFFFSSHLRTSELFDLKQHKDIYSWLIILYNALKK